MKDCRADGKAAKLGGGLKYPYNRICVRKRTLRVVRFSNATHCYPINNIIVIFWSKLPLTPFSEGESSTKGTRTGAALPSPPIPKPRLGGCCPHGPKQLGGSHSTHWGLRTSQKLLQRSAGEEEQGRGVCCAGTCWGGTRAIRSSGTFQTHLGTSSSYKAKPYLLLQHLQHKHKLFFTIEKKCFKMKGLQRYPGLRCHSAAALLVPLKAEAATL